MQISIFSKLKIVILFFAMLEDNWIIEMVVKRNQQPTNN